MIAVAEHGRMWVASISVLLLLHSTAHAQAPSAAMTVMAASVEKAQVTRSITATGSVVAWREIPISTEAGGLAIIEIAVDEGDVVAKGQILARLNNDLIKAEMLKQKATIGEFEASLASAKSEATRARSVAPGVLSAQTIEQRETLVKTAEAKLEACSGAVTRNRCAAPANGDCRPCGGHDRISICGDRSGDPDRNRNVPAHSRFPHRGRRSRSGVGSVCCHRWKTCKDLWPHRCVGARNSAKRFTGC